MWKSATFITGISDLIFYVRTERYTGFGPAVSLISGIFSIMAGVMLLVYPGAGRWVMVLLLPLWFIAHCVSRLSHLNFIRVTAGEIYYWFALIVNIIGIILGNHDDRPAYAVIVLSGLSDRHVSDSAGRG